jgi:GNAT superfamily N-acetyltransferase
VISDEPGIRSTYADEARIVAGFAGRAFSWWVGPAAPRELAARLDAIGLVAARPEPALALDLHNWSPASVGGLELAQVTSLPMLAAFARVLAANWDPPDGDVIRFYEGARDAALSPTSPLILLLGTVGGEPVATAEVALGTDGVGGLYNIATLAGWRRRGIGAGMTAAAIRAARGAGMRRLELQASEDGLGVYRRAGFVPTGEWTEFQPRRGSPAG